MEFMEKRRKHFAALRKQEKKNRPHTKAQKRSQMSTYLKHMVQRIKKAVKRRQKVVKSSEKKAEGSRKKSIGKKRVGNKQKQESSKRQRMEDDKETDEHKEAEEDDEAEIKKHLEIVIDEEIAIEVIPLATKALVIVEYKIDREGKMGYFKLIKADGSLKRYSSMIQMLQNIDREDLETLWKLVKAKHGNTRPEEDYERVLWGDLNVMFEPNVESEVWRNLQGYKVTVWKLFSSSGVHFVRFQNLHIFMLVEKKYPLTPATITMMFDMLIPMNRSLTP
ncbi:hypothetical protein Tco_0965852 [Tanacetum coccineum]